MSKDVSQQGEQDNEKKILKSEIFFSGIAKMTKNVTFIWCFFSLNWRFLENEKRYDKNKGKVCGMNFGRALK